MATPKSTPGLVGACLALIAVACVGFWCLRGGTSDVAGDSVVAPASSPDPGEPLTPGPIVAPLPSEPAVESLTAPRTAAEADRRAAPTPAAEPDAAPAVRGKVVDEFGRPVQRFEIASRRAGTHQPSKPARAEPRATSFESEHGEFALGECDVGEWLLEARSPTGVRSASVLVRVPQAAEVALLVLPTPALIQGTVLLPDGSPAPEAGIWTWTPGAQEPILSEESAAPPTARCDSRGYFTLPDVQAGGLRVLAALPPACDSGWTLVNAPAGRTTELTLRLRQGGRVVGAVADSMGVIAGREIALYSFKGLYGWRSQRTDAAGKFAFEGVPPQSYVVELSTERREDEHGISIAASQTRRRISVVEGATTEVKFDAEATSILVRGRATAGGRPLAGFSVQVQSLDSGEQGRDQPRTDKHGAFELRVTAPGRHSFFVSTEGSFATVEAMIDDRNPCDIALELPGGSIAGVVRNAKGFPASKAGVTILRLADPGTDEQATLVERLRLTQTDSLGRFEFQLLAPGTYVLRTPDRLSPRPEDKRIPFGRVVVPDIHVGTGPATALSIRLLPEGFVRGRVTDSQGNGVGNARVRLFALDGDALSATWNVATDATGDFGFDSVAPGSYTIGARVGDVAGPRVPVVVEEGETTVTSVPFP